MALREFGPCVALDPVTGGAVANGVTVLAWTAPDGGSMLQSYNSAGNAQAMVTEGGLVPRAYFESTDIPNDTLWYSAGAGRFQHWPGDFGYLASQAAAAAASIAASFDYRLIALENAAPGGGGGGSQLGLVEDVLTVKAEDGSTYIGADGATVTRAAFLYTAVPAGHRLVIKDNPTWLTSTVQPVLPTAFWSEAVKTDPQAEFISSRTPAAA